MALKHEELTAKIISVYYDVYNELGHGFLESVYHRAMLCALNQSGLRAESEVALPVSFRGTTVGDFRADIVVENVVLIELKTVQALENEHIAQVINYLKATPIEIGFLMNFGPHPAFKRIICDNPSKEVRLNPCESVVRVSK